MSVSEQPSIVERLLDRARPSSRRAKAAAAEAAGLQHLVGLLCPDPAPARTGRQPYDTGRTT